jgi:DNA-binding transcriptional LysR family regulator
VIGNAADLLKSLKTDDLEFVIASRDMLDTSARHAAVQSVGWVDIVALVRPGHPLAGRRITDKDLSDFPVLGGSPIDSSGSSQHPDYRPSIMCDNYEALRSVTLQSDAIWISAKCLARGDFVALRGASIARRNELVAVASPGRTLSPIAVRLLQDCKALLTAANAA